MLLIVDEYLIKKFMIYKWIYDVWYFFLKNVMYIFILWKMRFIVYDFGIGLGLFINFNVKEFFVELLFFFVYFCWFWVGSGDNL